MAGKLNPICIEAAALPPNGSMLIIGDKRQAALVRSALRQSKHSRQFQFRVLFENTDKYRIIKRENDNGNCTAQHIDDTTRI